MGQVINVEHQRVGNAIVFSADRSITGQSGQAFPVGADIPPSAGLAGELAVRLFDLDEAIDHVWAASNTVVVNRLRGWSDDDVDRAASVLSDFFVFYRDDD